MRTPNFPDSQVTGSRVTGSRVTGSRVAGSRGAGVAGAGGSPAGVPEARVAEARSELRCWQGYAFAMRGPHRHDDIEVNLVAEAPLTYLFGGTPVEIRPGQIGLFWAAMPHRLIDTPENWRSYVSWLHLPLDLVLKWGLPEEAVSRLLRGVPVVSESTGPRPDSGGSRRGSAGSLSGPVRPASGSAGLPDAGDFARWSADLGSGSGELRAIALLEIQAAIRRLVHQVWAASAGPDEPPGDHEREGRSAGAGLPRPDASPDQGGRSACAGPAAGAGPTVGTGPAVGDGSPIRADVGEPVRHAAAMARHAAAHFREPIGPVDVAAAVPLHPNYAMTVFRTVVGMTLGAYLAQCRIAEAQRLLITTGATTAEIAAASGFGSQSAFYAAFTKTCGLSPGAYRRTYR